MATIKAYTDLQQSKKLAEFLPIENADCYWDYDEMQKFHRISWFEDGYNKESQLILNENNACAWSLAALLSVLPDEISTGKGYQNKYEIDIRRYYGGNDITLYQIAYGNNKGSSGSWHDMISTSEQEKFVDVCYEMIIKLHEQNIM